MRKSFVLYNDSLSVLKEMTDEQAGKLFRAISAFHNKEEYEMDLLTKIAFANFKTYFQNNDEKYKQVSLTRSELGRKGGLAKASKSKQKLAKPSKATDTDTVTDTDNETVIDNDIKVSAPKVATKKNESEMSISFLMEEKWKIHLQLRFEMSYMSSSKDRKILNDIAQKLLFQVKEKEKKTNIIGAESENEKIMKAWNFILSNFEKWSKFHKGLKELSAINSTIITILSDAKNGTANQSKSDRLDFKNVAEQYIRNNQPNFTEPSQSPQTEQADSDSCDYEVLD